MCKKKSKLRVASAIAVGTLLVSGQALAAEDDSQLERIVVTATRVEQRAASIPGDVTVITAEQLKQKGARNLADALEGVPGVVVAKYGGSGENAFPYILGTDRVVVLVDGKRMNIPQGTGSGSGGINLTTIMLADNIEKIEVVRGGGSALYGADAVGGVINIVTKKGMGSVKSIVDAGVGSDGTHHLGIANQGEEHGWHWYITGTKHDTDGQRPNSDYTGKSASARLDKDLSKTERLIMTFDYYGSHGGNAGTITGNNQGANDYLTHNWSLGYSGKHDKGECIFRFYNNEQDRTYYTLPGMTRYFYENKVRTIEYQDSAKIDSNSELTWGSEWRKEKVMTADYGVVPNHERTVKAAYLQDQIKLSDKTTSTVGLRYDYSDQYGDNWLPKLAITHQADKNTNYFANWGKVFKAPKFDDLYTPWGGNPDLKPETGWTAELGMKKRLSSVSEATVSVFKRELNDAIDWAWVGPTDWDWQVRNVHHLTTKGATFVVGSKLSPAFYADFGYTYLDSRDETGKQLSPYNSCNLNLKFQAGKLTHTVSGRYLDKFYDSNHNKVASHFVWDTAFNYDLNKEQSIYLHVNNIFDKKYQNVFSYPAQERSVFFGIKQCL